MKHFSLLTILLACPILPSSLYGQQLEQESLHEVINTTLYLPLKKQDAKKIANQVPLEVFELIIRPGIKETLPLIAQDFDQTIENYLARTTKKTEPNRYFNLFQMISRRIGNVINQEKIDTKDKPFIQYPADLGRDIYTFLLAQSNLKFVLEKAVRQVALTKLHRYLHQLPETCREFIGHYGFYPERWYAYTHRTIPISQELRLGSHTITTNNNRDTLYALDKDATSILQIDAKTLKVIEQSPTFAQPLQQPAYDQKTDSIFLRTAPRDHSTSLIKYDIKTKTFNSIHRVTTKDFLTLFSQRRNELYLVYVKVHKLVSFNLATSEFEDFYAINDLFKHDQIQYDRSISCVKISPDGSKIIMESNDETLRVVDIQERDGKMVLSPYASLKNALSTSQYLSNCFTQSGLFEIYRPYNNLLSLWKIRKGKSKEECRIPINFCARQSPYTDTKFDWIDTRNYLSPNKTAFSDPQLKQVMFPMGEDQIPTYEESHDKYIYKVKADNGEEILVMSGGVLEKKYKLPPSARDNCNYILTTTNDEKILILSKPNEFTQLTPQFNLYQAALLYKLRKASKSANLQATFKKFRTAHYYDPRDGKDAKKKKIFKSFTPDMQIFLETWVQEKSKK